jgi:DNA-binding NarL/FixJ family response regulator
MHNQLSAHRFNDWEIAVMAFLVKGRTTREIGAALGMSERAIRSHLQKVIAKAGLPDRFAVVRWASDWLPLLYQARYGRH